MTNPYNGEALTKEDYNDYILHLVQQHVLKDKFNNNQRGEE